MGGKFHAAHADLVGAFLRGLAANDAVPADADRVAREITTFQMVWRPSATRARVSAQPDAAQLDHYMDRLDEIEQGVNNTRISTNHSDWSYNLRSHIDLVRNRLQKLENQTSQ